MSKKKNEENDNTISFKIILYGDSSSGKSEMWKKFINHTKTKTISTIGFGSFNKEITLKDGSTIKLNLIDTAGQENYKALSTSYIKNSDGILFVFSHNDKKSFDSIKEFLGRLKSESPNIDFKNNLPAYLVGNNCDLGHVMDNDEIKELKNEYDLYGYIDINFKGDNNINELFTDMSEILHIIYGKRKKTKNLKLAAKHKKNNNFNFI